VVGITGCAQCHLTGCSRRAACIASFETNDLTPPPLLLTWWVRPADFSYPEVEVDIYNELIKPYP
jgi:hypothetical protein